MESKSSEALHEVRYERRYMKNIADYSPFQREVESPICTVLRSRAQGSYEVFLHLFRCLKRRIGRLWWWRGCKLRRVAQRMRVATTVTRVPFEDYLEDANFILHLNLLSGCIEQNEECDYNNIIRMSVHGSE